MTVTGLTVRLAAKYPVSEGEIREDERYNTACAMALYRVEILERNGLGLHETVDFHEFDAPDVPAALAAADTWLRAKDLGQTRATDARVMIGERIIAEKELGRSTWNDPA